MSWREFGVKAKFLGPIIMTVLGVPAPIVALAVNGMAVAEAISNGQPKTGAEKKEIAMSSVVTGLQAVNAAKPGAVDIAELTGVVSEGIDLTVKAIKAGKNIPIPAQ